MLRKLLQENFVKQCVFGKLLIPYACFYQMYQWRQLTNAIIKKIKPVWIKLFLIHGNYIDTGKIIYCMKLDQNYCKMFMTNSNEVTLKIMQGLQLCIDQRNSFLHDADKVKIPRVPQVDFIFSHMLCSN